MFKQNTYNNIVARAKVYKSKQVKDLVSNYKNILSLANDAQMLMQDKDTQDATHKEEYVTLAVIYRGAYRLYNALNSAITSIGDAQKQFKA